MVSKLVHFSIPVSNLPRASAFYLELLGWSFKEMTPTYWLSEDGMAALSLESGPAAGSMPILYFGVDDIVASLQKAEAAGGMKILGKTDAGDGNSAFATFRDLDGNTIGLWSKA